MKLYDGNILHVVCTGTLSQHGKFMRSMTGAETWRALRRCWINAYAGLLMFLFMIKDPILHPQNSVKRLMNMVLF